MFAPPLRRKAYFWSPSREQMAMIDLPPLARFFDELCRDDSPDAPAEAHWLEEARRLELTSRRQCDELLERLLQLYGEPSDDPAMIAGAKPKPKTRLNDALLDVLLEPLWRRYRREEASAPSISPGEIEKIALLYGRLPAGVRPRWRLLRALTASADTGALTRFAEIVVSDPLQETGDCDLAFVPLFQQQGYEAAALFPRLLEALQHPALAPLVLDLANYLLRSRQVDRHPAADRVKQLVTLFSGLVSHLQELESRPGDYADNPQTLARKVGDSATLLVCSAMR